MILKTQLRGFQSKVLQMNLKVPSANFTRHSARLRKPISLRAPGELRIDSWIYAKINIRSLTLPCPLDMTQRWLCDSQIVDEKNDKVSLNFFSFL